MNALTRKEVIKEWNKNKHNHNYYVCPNCRDLLHRKDTLDKGIVIQCNNEQCDDTHYYNIFTGEQL